MVCVVKGMNVGYGWTRKRKSPRFGVGTNLELEGRAKKLRFLKISMWPHTHICSILWGSYLWMKNYQFYFVTLGFSFPPYLKKNGLHSPDFVELFVLLMVIHIGRNVLKYVGICVVRRMALVLWRGLNGMKWTSGIWIVPIACLL